MHRGVSPVRSGDDKSRLAVLKAELEDLDNMFSSPSRALSLSPRPLHQESKDVTRLLSSTKPKAGGEKRQLLDNYEHVLAENAHVRRQVHYLSKEVAGLSGRRSPMHHRSPPSQPASPSRLNFDDVPSAQKPLDVEAIRRRTDARLSSSSPAGVATPRKHTTTVTTKALVTTTGNPSDIPLESILLGEMTQKDAELEQMERKLAAYEKKAQATNDLVRQTSAMLKKNITTSPRTTVSELVLATQHAVDILDEIRGDDAMHGFDERLRQRVDEHEQAKSRIAECRRQLDGSVLEDREDRLMDVLARHELAAVAADGIKKQYAQKMMMLTRQLCDKQSELSLSQDVVKQKNEQLKAAHEALAHTTTQLAAVTDTTKELSRVQEEKQNQDIEIGRLQDEITQRDRKIRQLSQERETAKEAHDRMRDAESRCEELAETNTVATAEVRELKLLAEQQRAQLTDLQKALDIKTEAYARIEAQLGGCEQDYEILEKESTLAKQRATEAVRELAETTERCNRFEGELIASEDRVSKLTGQLQASVAEVQSLTDGTKEMAAKLDATNLELVAVNTTFVCLPRTLPREPKQESLKIEQAEKIQTQRECVSLKGKAVDFQRQKDELLQKIREKESLEAIQQEDLFRKDTHAEQLVKQLREKTAELEAKEREVGTREIDVKKKAATLSEREEMLQAMEKELITKRQELGHSVVNNTISNSKIVELTQLLENKEAELGDLKATNLALAENLRSVEAEHDQDLERTVQLERVIEMVRAQLQENTTQFGVLTEDLQTTRTRLETEITQRGVLEEQLRAVSEASAAYATQNKNLEAEALRLQAANEALNETSRRQADVLSQQKSAHEREVADVRQRLAEADGLREQARQQAEGLLRSERRAEECKKESLAATEMIKDVQRELVHRQAQSDDAVRNACNLWGAIARLGRKFDDYEKNLQLRGASRSVNEKFEDASSFLRYIRGWWSMYKDKDPSLELNMSPAHSPPTTIHTMSPGRIMKPGDQLES